MNALGRALRALGRALIALTDEELAAPPRAPARSVMAPPEEQPASPPNVVAARLCLDETDRLLLARIAESDPDALDEEALRDEGRVAHRIGYR